MNSLSWFLYLADAAGRLGIAFLVFGLIATAVGAFSMIAFMVSTSEKTWLLGRDGSKDYVERETAKWDAWLRIWGPLRKGVVYGFLLISISCLIPEKNTLYAIAASEMGEKIVKNEGVKEFGGDVARALQNWIKQQLAVPETRKSK